MRDLSELRINAGGKSVQRPFPSAEAINAFQTHHDVVFPEAYLRLLQYSNGGHPELDSFEPANRPGASRWSINRFYHLDNDRTSPGNLWTAMGHWSQILGKGTIPFASDAGGNQYFLDLKTSPASVKMCLHDENFAVVELALSFEDFIDRLSIDPEMI